MPRFEVLLKIADSTNVNLHWLVTGRGPKRAQENEQGITRREGDKKVAANGNYLMEIEVTEPEMEILERLAAEQHETPNAVAGDILIDGFIARGLMKTGADTFQFVKFELYSEGKLRSVTIPLMGIVAAGKPIQYLLDGETVEVPEELVEGPSCFALKVKGDSMKDEGIFDGDIIVVKPTSDFANGQTIVLEVSGIGGTVKRVYRKGPKFELHSANPEFEPMSYHARDVVIRGIVVGIKRSEKRRF